MKRPLCVIGASFAVAMTVAFLLPKYALLFSGAVFVTALIFLLLRKDALTPIAVALLSGAIALAYGALYQHSNVTVFQSALGEDMTAEGLVMEVTQTGSNAWRHTLEVNFPEEDLPKATIVVRSYGRVHYEPGEMLRLSVRLKDAKYKTTATFFKREGIVAESVLTDDVERIPSYGRYALYQKVLEHRSKLDRRLKLALPAESAGLTSAMVIGVTEDLTQEQFTALNVSGTLHLISVSGFHFSILAAVIGRILSALGISQRKQTPILLFLLGSFVVLVGFSAPIVRAFIMMVLVLIAGFARRKSDALNSLGFSALVISILWPHWLLTMGMWLSFLSTAGIIVIGAPFARWLVTWYGEKIEQEEVGTVATLVMEGLAITIGAYLFTLPVLVFGTGIISLVSPITNVLVTPFSWLVTVGGMALALLPSGFFALPLLAAVVHFSARMILEISIVLAKLPFAVYSLDYSYILIFAILVFIGIIAVLILYRKGWIPWEKKRVIAVITLVSVFLFASGNLAHYALFRDRLEVVSLEDTDTTLLIKENHAVLLGMPDQYSAGKVMRYLQFRGIDTLDAMIIPNHGEQIRSELLAFSESFRVKAVVGPDDSYILEELSQALPGIPVYASGYATIQVLDEVKISFSPDQRDYAMEIRGQQLLKTDKEYAIIRKDFSTLSQGLVITPEGMHLPRGISAAWEPIATQVYGETRVYL